MNMKRKIFCLMIIVAVMAGIQGVAVAAETGDQLWLRTMTSECVREMVEIGVGAEDAEMYANQYQFMAMTMKGQTKSGEEADAERIGSALGKVLGVSLTEQGKEAMTDAAFAFMSANRAGMAPEIAAAAEAQLLRSRYTIQNVTRVMTQATEMMRTMQPEDKGAALGEMIRTMAQNKVTAETMTQTMAQSGQGNGGAGAGGSGSGSGSGSGAGSPGGAGSGGAGSGSGGGGGHSGK
ncbi:MAG: hypothetical protein Q7I97_04855 [Thermovirgaceae bacterium]|nr:hypothetical protein [Thermovirgaceae bacterium]